MSRRRVPVASSTVTTWMALDVPPERGRIETMRTPAPISSRTHCRAAAGGGPRSSVASGPLSPKPWIRTSRDATGRFLTVLLPLRAFVPPCFSWATRSRSCAAGWAARCSPRSGSPLGVGLVIGIIGVSQGLDEAQSDVLAPLRSVGTDILVTRVAGTTTECHGRRPPPRPRRRPSRRRTRWRQPGGGVASSAARRRRSAAEPPGHARRCSTRTATSSPTCPSSASPATSSPTTSSCRRRC